MRHPLILLLCAALFPLALSSAGENSKRTADRQTRMNILKTIPDAQKKITANYLALLASNCQWLVGLGDKTDAGSIVSEITMLDPEYAKLTELKKAVDEIADSKTLDDLKQKEFTTRLKTACKSRAMALSELANTCYRAGLYGQAYDLLQQCIDSEPDNAAARAAFGQVRAGDVWCDPYEAALRQKGNVYVSDAGWVPAAAAEHVKKGEWQENGRWVPIADADKIHSEVNAAWTIESQNFILKSTADRKTTVKLAERLEGFRKACYREYVDFFVHGSPQHGSTMQFTQAPSRKMQVYFYAQKKDYEAVVKREVKGILQTVVMLFPGLYYSNLHASHFNGETAEPLLGFFVQHEVARQFLMEYASAGTITPKPWLAEGVPNVVILAAPNADGKWAVPSGHQNSNVSDTIQLMKDGRMAKLGELLNYTDQQFHNPVNSDNNSHEAAALCVFLLETKDGAYAADFQEFMFESYRGSKNVNLNDFIGLDTPALEKAFLEFLGN